MELDENKGPVKEVVQKGEKMIEQLEKGMELLWVIFFKINDGLCVLQPIKFTQSVFIEGLSSEVARSGLDSVRKEWESCQKMIQDLRKRVQVLEQVTAVLSGLKAVDGVLQEQEKWLTSTKGFRAKDNQQELQTLRDDCEVSQIPGHFMQDDVLKSGVYKNYLYTLKNGFLHQWNRII